MNTPSPPPDGERSEIEQLVTRLRNMAVAHQKIAPPGYDVREWPEWKASDLITTLRSRLDEAERENERLNVLIEQSNRRASELLKQLRTIAAETREACARIAEEWLHVQTLKLHCGELTAQEVRTVLAVMKSRAAAIRSAKEGEFGKDEFRTEIGQLG